MRRVKFWIGFGLLAFVFAALGGFVLTAKIAPGKAKLRAEEALSNGLQLSVSSDAARLALSSRGIAFQLENVTAVNHAGQPVLRAKTVETGLALLPILLGRTEVRYVVLDRPVLHLYRQPDGNWNYPLIKTPRVLEESAPNFTSRLEESIHSFTVFLQRDWGNIRFDIREGHFTFLDFTQPDTEGKPFRLEIQEFSSEILPGGLLGDTETRVRGRLIDPEPSLSLFSLVVQKNLTGKIHSKIEITSINLNQFVPYLFPIQPEKIPAGRLSGTIQISGGIMQPWEASLDLVALDLETALPRPGERDLVPFESAEARVQLAILLDSKSIQIQPSTLTLQDQITLSVSAQIERPIQPESRAEIQIHTQDLSLQDLKETSNWLPPETRERMEIILQPITSTRIHRFSVEASAQLKRWSPNYYLEKKRFPGQIRFEVDFSEATVELPRGPLEKISARIIWNRDQLEVHHFRAQWKGNPIPEINVTVDGAEHLLFSRRLSAPPLEEVTPLYGIPLLGKIFPMEPDTQRTEWDLLVEGDQISNPILVWPIEGMRLMTHREAEGTRFQLLTGIWGDALVHGEGTWTGEGAGVFDLHFFASLSDHSAKPLEDPDSLWGKGRWTLRYPNSPDSPFQAVVGKFETQKTEIRLLNIQAPFGSTGSLSGSAHFEFSDQESLPYDFSFHLVNADMKDIAPLLLLSRSDVVGMLGASGEISGEMIPEQSKISTMEGNFSVFGFQGELYKELPVFLAMARATDTFNLFGSRKQIRFKNLHSRFHLQRGGNLEIENFAVEGGDLRLLANGSVNIVESDHLIDLEVGCFFFRVLDKAIDWIPGSNVIMGKDGNLLGAYLDVQGPWSEPKATLSSKTAFEGPAHFLLEGIPELFEAMENNTLDLKEKKSDVDYNDFRPRIEK